MEKRPQRVDGVVVERGGEAIGKIAEGVTAWLPIVFVWCEAHADARLGLIQARRPKFSGGRQRPCRIRRVGDGH